MSGRFFITGLPRSRTAWFSVATTTPASVCFHEPTSGLQSFEDLREFWAPKYGVDFGVSDSSLAPQVERILDELSPRTIIIERGVNEAIRSYLEYAEGSSLAVEEGACRAFSNRAVTELHKMRGHPLVRCVTFEALNDYETMLDTMRWLLPGREFPDLRHLMRLNIQASLPYVESIAGRPHSGWHLERL